MLHIEYHNIQIVRWHWTNLLSLLHANLVYERTPNLFSSVKKQKVIRFFSPALAGNFSLQNLKKGLTIPTLFPNGVCVKVRARKKEGVSLNATWLGFRHCTHKYLLKHTLLFWYPFMYSNLLKLFFPQRKKVLSITSWKIIPFTKYNIVYEVCTYHFFYTHLIYPISFNE